MSITQTETARAAFSCQTEVSTVLPVNVTSRDRPTFTESNRGMRTSSKSVVWLEALLYSQAELRGRDRDLLLAQRVPLGTGTAPANTEQPKYFPPHTNRFQANQTGGLCAAKFVGQFCNLIVPICPRH